MMIPIIVYFLFVIASIITADNITAVIGAFGVLLTGLLFAIGKLLQIIFSIRKEMREAKAELKKYNEKVDGHLTTLLATKDEVATAKIDVAKKEGEEKGRKDQKIEDLLLHQPPPPPPPPPANSGTPPAQPPTQ